jgi:hypothetical protein
MASTVLRLRYEPLCSPPVIRSCMVAFNRRQGDGGDRLRSGLLLALAGPSRNEVIAGRPGSLMLAGRGQATPAYGLEIGRRRSCA